MQNSRPGGSARLSKEWAMPHVGRLTAELVMRKLTRNTLFIQELS